jgi:hypothetical protein
MRIFNRLLRAFLFLIQAKKVAYLFTVLCGNFGLLYALYLQHELTTMWVSAFSILTAFVTGGYLGGKYLTKGNP